MQVLSSGVEIVSWCGYRVENSVPGYMAGGFERHTYL